MERQGECDPLSGSRQSQERPAHVDVVGGPAQSTRHTAYTGKTRDRRVGAQARAGRCNVNQGAPQQPTEQGHYHWYVLVVTKGQNAHGRGVGCENTLRGGLVPHPHQCVVTNGGGTRMSEADGEGTRRTGPGPCTAVASGAEHGRITHTRRPSLPSPHTVGSTRRTCLGTRTRRPVAFPSETPAPSIEANMVHETTTQGRTNCVSRGTGTGTRKSTHAQVCPRPRKHYT